MKIGDIVERWGNRISSNGINLANVRKAKVIKTPRKLNSWDTKKSMVIEILEGTAKRNSGYVSNIIYDSVRMSAGYNARYKKGDKLIVFADAFFVSASQTEEIEYIPTSKPSEVIQKLNPNTLMLLMG